MKKVLLTLLAMLGIATMTVAQQTVTKTLDMSVLATSVASNEAGSTTITNDNFVDAGGEGWLAIVDGVKNTWKDASYFESAKGNNGAFTVTLESDGTITIDLASTGTFNHTSFALKDESENYVTLTTDIDENVYVLGEGTTITDDGATDGNANENNVNDGEGVTLGAGEYVIYTSGNHQEVTWAVEAGTYTFAANILESDPFNRGARIYGITVVEEVEEETEPGIEEEPTGDGDFILPIVELFQGGNVGDWGSGTEAELNQAEDALVLTFVQGWGSYVFTNWWPCWDLSAYDTAILTYSFDGEFVSEGNYAQLIVEDNTTDYNTVSANDNNMDRGVVTVDLTSNPALDLTDIAQIAVQTEKVGTITVEEIRFTYTGSSTAISSAASNVEVTEVARYNLMGQKISGAEKGINIIVYSDGTAKKVLVK